jgi:hypothetical protein
MKIKLLLSILLIILLVQPILAIDIQNPTDSETFKKTEDTKNRIEDIRDSNNLTKEFTDLLHKSEYLSKVYSLNPLFKFLFGREFSLSWAFLASIIIWLGIVWLYSEPAKFIFKDTFSSIAFAILVGAITTNLLTERIIETASNILKTTSHNFLFILGLIIIFAIMGTVEKLVIKSIRKSLEKKRIDNIEKEVKGSYKNIHSGLTSMKRGYDRK